MGREMAKYQIADALTGKDLRIKGVQNEYDTLPGRGVSFENGTAHHQGDQGANNEFQHMLPSDWMRVEGVYSDRGSWRPETGCCVS